MTKIRDLTKKKQANHEQELLQNPKVSPVLGKVIEMYLPRRIKALTKTGRGTDNQMINYIKKT